MTPQILLFLLSGPLFLACDDDPGTPPGDSGAEDTGDDTGDGGIPEDTVCKVLDTGGEYPPVDTETDILGPQGFEAEDWPRVDGSTATGPLSWVVACERFDIPYAWVEDASTGAYGIVPIPEDEAQLLTVSALEQRIIHQGTHAAYTALVDGTVDLLLESRGPTDEELAYAADAGVTMVLEPIALDALVFLGNVSNPVDELSWEQLRLIYLGTITRWDQVGGPTAAITPYHRNASSGSYELMAELVMEGASMPDWPDAWEVAVMGAMIDMVAGDKFGLGYSVFFYVDNMYPDFRIRTLATDCVLPTRSTIASRDFPFTSTTYVVTRDDLEPGSPGAALRDWFRTEEGALAIARSGYVPYDQ